MFRPGLENLLDLSNIHCVDAGRLSFIIGRQLQARRICTIGMGSTAAAHHELADSVE